jgi:hypothetical protein
MMTDANHARFGGAAATTGPTKRDGRIDCESAPHGRLAGLEVRN